MNIDEEIKDLVDRLQALDDTHPDYLPDEIKDLRSLTLTLHANLERAIELRILRRLEEKIGAGEKDYWHEFASEVRIILEKVSYRDKVELVKSYNDCENSMIQALNKVNSLRNKMVHRRGEELRSEFDLSGSRGKEEYRNVLRALESAHLQINTYFEHFIQDKS